MHPNWAAIFSACTTALLAIALYRVQRRDSKADQAAQNSKEANETLNGLVTDLRVLSTSLAPLPRQVQSLEARVETHGREIAVVTNELHNFKSETKEDIKELRKKTFYNGGQE